MRRNLHQIAKAINETPKLGLIATSAKSSSSTDSKVAGTRFRRQGKGRKGVRLVVKLVKTGEVVCDHDSSQTYRTNDEVERWLEKWAKGDRWHKNYSRKIGK